MSTYYPKTHPDAPRLRDCAVGLALWIVSITIGVGVFFQAQMFVALMDVDTIDTALLLVRALGVFAGIGAVVGVFTGAGVVAVQQLAPLHPIVRTEAWVLGNMGAWALAGALFEMLYWITIPLDEVPSYFIIGAGVGLGFGLAQCLASHRALAKSQFLLAANVVGWCLGLTAGGSVYQLKWGSAQGYVLSVIVVGIIASVITGIILSRLATRPPKDIAES